MKTITIARLGSHKTVVFAADELKKYLSEMDKTVLVDVLVCQQYDQHKKNYLWVGTDEAFADRLPKVKNPTYDDSILLDVTDFCGIITGGNIRSVLLAVYRFLKELGVAFVRPGPDGEVIPQKKLNTCQISLCETPSYRHRIVCIEGSTGYSHAQHVIDWVPKAGMNGYFIQFFLPYVFFERWYSHPNNPALQGEEITREDCQHLLNKLTEDITLRSLVYEAVGHGFTSSVLGLVSDGWSTVAEEDVDPDMTQYMAMIDGKRQVFKGSPLNTELCFSNPTVRSKMVDIAVNYCKENPDVNHLYFTLADEGNNHCECEDCQKKLPSEWYVDMLNELDERLTKEHIETKLVVAVYMDLLWAPKQNKLNNPDRFIFEFAPIQRNFRSSFADMDLDKEYPERPFVRNRLNFPGNVGMLHHMLKNWQETCPGCDAFDFDYHLWSVHLKDLGYYGISRTMSRDIHVLDQLGLNGFVSCQLQRVAFPTNLPMETMAQTLWNKDTDFETMAQTYFINAFGPDGAAVKDYLEKISQLLSAEYYYGEKVVADWTPQDYVDRLTQGKAFIRSFRNTILEHVNRPLLPAQKKSYEYLLLHSEVAERFADIAIAKRLHQTERADKLVTDCEAYLASIEETTHPVFDSWRMGKILELWMNYH